MQPVLRQQFPVAAHSAPGQAWRLVRAVSDVAWMREARAMTAAAVSMSRLRQRSPRWESCDAAARKSESCAAVYAACHFCDQTTEATAKRRVFSSVVRTDARLDEQDVGTASAVTVAS
eukprot:4381012-Pyramimonas_sp.AAC.1